MPIPHVQDSGSSLLQTRLRVRIAILRVGLTLAASAGVLAGTAAAAGATAVPANAMQPAAMVQPATTTTIFHTCAVFGNDETKDHLLTEQAVHCANLLRKPGVDGETNLWVENEVYCQSSSGAHALIPCKGMLETLSDGGINPAFPNGFTEKDGTQGCGTPFHHSACGALRNFHSSGVTFTLPNGTHTCSIWAESTSNKIVFRSSLKEVTSLVIATPHFNFRC
jgi:hypothetical protein